MSSKYLFLSLFSVILLLEPTVADSNHHIIRCIDEEREALLTFKQGLVDENGFLSSWGGEHEKRDCCQWTGIYCRNKTGHVYALDLRAMTDSPGQALRGTISPSLLKLKHLTYLDLSSNNFSGSPIPEFIGSLSKLSSLILADAEFSGPIPHQLGNLSRLQVLELRFNNLFSGDNLEWLSGLSSLISLDLTANNLSKFSNWVQVLSKLQSLTTLYLDFCDLPPIIPSSLLYLNSSKSLEAIGLSENNLTNSVYPWLFNVSSNLLEFINLGSNQLQGSIPEDFGRMVSLRNIRFYSNQFREVPNFLGNMSSLQILDLSENELREELSEYIQNVSSGCTKNSLKWLLLDSNEITGSVPDLGGFSSLEELTLDNNRLNGTINKGIGQLLKLELLKLNGNSLRGIVSEALFSNLSRLGLLDLADNSLTLEFSPDWIPPFQLGTISLASCKMGSRFPKWLQTQNQTVSIDISNAGISDTVPSWFWDLTHQLVFLNLSNNQMKGKLPDLSFRFDSYGTVIDISSNHFEGLIPPLPSNTTSINFSKNKFLGPISFVCSLNGQLTYLDLSNNLLSGRLPDCWVELDSLAILNLANNNFFGKIPDSMGFLHNIQSLSLYNNYLTGELPSFSMNFSQLTLMNLGKNGLSGEIPSWIGESFPKLVVLSLKSNKFYGNIPFQLCYLAHIQILDISLNNISGIIPKCFHNFTAMTQMKSSNRSIIANYQNIFSGAESLPPMPRIYLDKTELTWKGSQYEYETILGLVKIIDLSSNKLGGEVPEEIMDLKGLVALNLSRNNLTGQITPKIGQLKSLDFLDLSRNQFFGGIPSSLSQLSGLSIMDVSYNNLSGKIPLGTQLQSFNVSFYAGNPKLCGLPLPNKCPDEESTPAPSRDDANTSKEDDQFGFYLSLILGFFIGFWGVCGILLVKRSWRHGYYNFLTRIKDWVYMTALVNIAKLKRRFRN